MSEDESVISLEVWVMGPPRARRGFGAMSVEKRTEIAKKGGASVHPSQRSFSKDRKLAAEAGSKGGQASRGGGRPPQEPPEEP